MLTYIGLIIITFAWMWQWKFLQKKKKSFQLSFVYLYSLGVLTLVLGNLLSGLYIIALMNLASFLSSLLVIIRLRK